MCLMIMIYNIENRKKRKKKKKKKLPEISSHVGIFPSSLFSMTCFSLWLWFVLRRKSVSADSLGNFRIQPVLCYQLLHQFSQESLLPLAYTFCTVKQVCVYFLILHLQREQWYIAPCLISPRLFYGTFEDTKLCIRTIIKYQAWCINTVAIYLFICGHKSNTVSLQNKCCSNAGRVHLKLC